ncbi:MAG: vWA domain-containing protein [Gemmataceae bacterium]
MMPARGASKGNPAGAAGWHGVFAKRSNEGSTMSQLKKVVEPFGEVNVYPAAGGKVRVVATILMEPHKEGAQTGIALDGSGSMSKLYGVEEESGGFLATLFGGKKKPPNEVTPVAQKVCAYLARKIDADGGTTCIYWAVGPSGSQIEEIGDLRADEAERHIFGPPKNFGTGTQLLPAVKYFVERFRDAPWGFYVFITDGELHDLDEVKRYSVQLARDIAARRRQPLKFVLIGVGPSVNEEQMEELDDLETGTPLDLWDHKLAAEMRMLQEIFAEVVDKNARIADHGRIVDPHGRTIKDYSDTGMSAYLEFEMPAGAEYFTLEVNGNKIHQGLSDGAQVPPAQLA